MIVEPCPRHLARQEKPVYGGSLFFRLELGRAGCGNPECGWSGVPVTRGAIASTYCPACEHEPDPPAFPNVVALKPRRNDPCSCGSGVKAKRCCYG